MVVMSDSGYFFLFPELFAIFKGFHRGSPTANFPPDEFVSTALIAGGSANPTTWNILPQFPLHSLRRAQGAKQTYPPFYLFFRGGFLI
jgi:hypothetical protein